MRRKLLFILFVIIMASVMLIPTLASAEAEESVIDLEIGATTEGVLKDGKVKIYEIEPACNGLLTLTIKCYAKDELHTIFYPEGKSDPYPKITRYNAGKGYSLLEYKAYVASEKYRLELSNPTIVMSGSYRIHAAFTPITTIDYERNNSVKDAVSISNHKYYPGVMTYDENEDYYSIKLNKSTQFQLKVACFEKTWLNITVKNSKGNVVDEGKAYHNTIIYLLEQKLAAGTYTIIISPNRNDGFYGRSYHLETGTYVPIRELSLPSAKSMKPGEIYQLKPTLKPSGASNSCYYTSSNPDVVKVTLEGRVTAIKKGKATITARPFDGKAMDTCTITVGKATVQKSSLKKTKVPEPTPKPKPTATPTPIPTPVIVTVDKISMSNSLEMKVGETKELEVTFTPANVTNKTLIWTCTDGSVVTLQDGKVTGKKAGITTVVVTSVNGKRTFCKIEVSE